MSYSSRPSLANGGSFHFSRRVHCLTATLNIYEGNMYERKKKAARNNREQKVKYKKHTRNLDINANEYMYL